MTWIRIDPNEMETASRELQSCSTTVGDTAAGLQAQCTGCAMPAAVSAQVATGLAVLERQLQDIRVEILLEATILALRGLLAVKGSAVAGLMSMDVPAPTTGFGGGNDGYTGLTSDWMTRDGFGTSTVGGNDGYTGLTSDWMIRNGFGTSTLGGSPFPSFSILNADGTDAGPGLFSNSAIVGPPSSPGIAALPAPLFNLLSDSNQHIYDVIGEPSRAGLMTDEGHYISPTEYTQRGYRGLI